MDRVGEPKGAKAELVRSVVNRHKEPFRLSDIERECPGVGRDWIRKIFRDLKKDGILRPIGHGAGAKWTLSKNNKGSHTPK